MSAKPRFSHVSKKVSTMSMAYKPPSLQHLQRRGSKLATKKSSYSCGTPRQQRGSDPSLARIFKELPVLWLYMMLLSLSRLNRFQSGSKMSRTRPLRMFWYACAAIKQTLKIRELSRKKKAKHSVKSFSLIFISMYLRRQMKGWVRWWMHWPKR